MTPTARSRTRAAAAAAAMLLVLSGRSDPPAARVLIHDLGSVPGECFLFRPLDGSELHRANALECRLASAPASTFKIPHALIALETGVVSAGGAPTPWDGSPQPFPSWQRAHSLDSAIRDSVLWYFRRTAGLIGPDQMHRWLDSIGYGADTFAGDVTSFWLNGDLVVTPEAQLDFLARMFRGELPVSRGSVDAVRRAMTMPAGRLTNASGTHRFVTGWPAGTLVRAKTGNARVGDEHFSWLIGQIESRGRQFVFVARARSAQSRGSTAGAAVAERYLPRLVPRS